MSILLTGSSGFIGGHFFNNDKIKRIAVRNEYNGHQWGCYKYHIDSLDGTTDWSGAFDGIDSIIHLAALAHALTCTNDDYQKVNVDGALHLAKQAALSGVKRFVFVSSIGVNGTSTQSEPFTFDAEAHPHNTYAQSKYDSELGLKKIAEETGLEVVIVRPTLVYGPDAPGNFGMLTKLVSKVPILPFGLAKNRRNFIAVQNLVDLLATCATHPDAAGHTFLASDPETLSTREFTNAIAEGLGKRVFQLPVPVSLMRFGGKLTGKSSMIEQLFGNLEVDSSNIKEVLNWTAPLTMKQAMKTLRETGKNKQ